MFTLKKRPHDSIYIVVLTYVLCKLIKIANFLSYISRCRAYCFAYTLLEQFIDNRALNNIRYAINRLFTMYCAFVLCIILLSGSLMVT